jgi:hypothetical protein
MKDGPNPHTNHSTRQHVTGRAAGGRNGRGGEVGGHCWENYESPPKTVWYSVFVKCRFCGTAEDTAYGRNLALLEGA